jgi:hypothetical protein
MDDWILAAGVVMALGAFHLCQVGAVKVFSKSDFGPQAVIARGLRRLWIAISVGWLVWCIWWIVTHRCAWDAPGLCNFDNAATSILSVPVISLAVILTAYWVIRGFQGSASERDTAQGKPEGSQIGAKVE